MKSRMAWVDIARGIGILAVILGHGLNADSYRHIIYAFHMPLFFFISGVVFHHRKYPRFLPFVTRQVKTILLPYFIFALLTYVAGFYALKFGNVSPDHIKQHILWVLYGNGNNNQLFFNVVLWFLPVLFVSKVSFALITQFVTKRHAIFILLIAISLLGFVLSHYFRGLKLPFGIETAVTATVFFGLGYLWNTQEKLKNIVSSHISIILPVSIVLLITIGQLTMHMYGSQVDMLQNKLHNYVLFYSGALSGIFLCISISMFLKQNMVLETLGKKSLILFVWHLIVFSYFGFILQRFFHVNSSALQDFRNTVIAPVYTVLSILVILSIDQIIQFVKKAGRPNF